jgi:hypothetical protein
MVTIVVRESGIARSSAWASLVLVRDERMERR